MHNDRRENPLELSWLQPCKRGIPPKKGTVSLHNKDSNGESLYQVHNPGAFLNDSNMWRSTAAVVTASAAQAGNNG